MSGIFGVIDPTNKTDVRAVSEKMVSAMSHRDWYQSSHYINETKTLAVGRIGIGIFVHQINHFLNARLNNDFGTFIAGKECHIERCASKIGAALVQNGIYFGMTHIVVLAVEWRGTMARPGQDIV